MSTTVRRYVDRETETMSPGQLGALQLARLNAFLDRSVWDNPWFTHRLGRRREIRSLEEWRTLPTMTKADVLADIAEHGSFGRRCTAAPSEIRQIVETSGTSGKGRERYPITDHDLDLIQQMEMPGFRWAGAEPGSVVLSSLPVTTRAGGQWYQDAVRRLGAVWLSVGTYPAEEKLRYLREIGADILVASPSYLMRLEIVAAAEGIVPGDLGIRAIMTAGEPFSLAWAQERAEVWGARLHEQYGSTQRAIAWSCEEGAVHGNHLGVLHVLPHLAVYEVIDPVTGEEVVPGEHGELVITPFGSSAAPLVRFATGDRVVKVGTGECPCGRPYPGLRCGRIDRYDAMTKIRGVNVVPSAADEVLLQPPVTDYQARVYNDEQTGREELEIVVAAAGGLLDTAALDDLAVRFRQAFGLRATFVAHPGPTLVGDVTVDARKRARWTDERAPMRAGAST